MKPKGGDARRASPGLGKASLIVQRRREDNILIVGGSINKIFKIYTRYELKRRPDVRTETSKIMRGLRGGNQSDSVGRAKRRIPNQDSVTFEGATGC